LSIQEVLNGNWVSSIGDIGRFEHRLHMSVGVDAHVLLTEGFRMLLEVGVLLRGH
jgi:hypothetical protein